MDDTHRLVPDLIGPLDSAAFGFALFDPQDRLIHCNPWFAQAYGVAVGDHPTWEAMMRQCHATRRGVLIETADIDAWLETVRTRYRKRPVRAFQSDLCDGRWVWVVETTRDDGWLTMAVSDVSPLKETERALQVARDDAVRTSMKDPLTDLSNRRFIMGHLGEMLAGSRAIRFPLSLVMLDIDHFKQINDELGHDVGDHVLRHFAQLLEKQLRPADAVGRIGGEEFMFVLPNTAIDGATSMLGRVRQLIEQAVTARDAGVPAYTFSAGIAEAGPDDSVDTLFRRADQALFRAKREGRNRDCAVDVRSMRP